MIFLRMFIICVLLSTDIPILIAENYFGVKDKFSKFKIDIQSDHFEQHQRISSMIFYGNVQCTFASVENEADKILFFSEKVKYDTKSKIISFSDKVNVQIFSQDLEDVVMITSSNLIFNISQKTFHIPTYFDIVYQNIKYESSCCLDYFYRDSQFVLSNNELPVNMNIYDGEYKSNVKSKIILIDLINQVVTSKEKIKIEVKL